MTRNFPTLSFCFHLLILLCISLFSFQASAGETPIEYSAKYQLHHNNAPIGKVTLVVQKLSNAKYKLTSNTTTSSLAKLLGAGDSVKTSLFEYVNSRPRPLAYQYQNGEDIVELTFDWASARVTNHSEKPVETRSLKPGALDNALMQVALMQDLSDSKKKSNLSRDGWWAI